MADSWDEDSRAVFIFLGRSMEAEKDSLIDREAQQLKLLPSAEMERVLFAEEEAVGNYTAENLFKQYPERYQAALSFLSEGIGILRIARILHMSPSSVMAIREREPRQIEIEKARLSRLARDLAGLCVEAAVDRFGDPEALKKIPLRDLGILHGIMVEKAELLSGGATARVDHGDQAPGHSELLRYLESLRVRSAMGSGAENGGQKDGKIIDVTEQVAVSPAPGAGSQAAGNAVQATAGSMVPGDGDVDKATGSMGNLEAAGTLPTDYVSSDSKQNDQQNGGNK